MTTRYGADALRIADQEIRQLAPGGRNPGTFPHAAGVYELVAGGEIDSEEADRVLFDAGMSIGLPRHEVVSVLRSARKKGAQKPRRSPDNKGSSPEPFRPLPPIPPAPPTYPPLRAVQALWGAADSVLAHEDACAYLERRGLDPERVSRFGRCRYLPKGAPLPNELIPELRDAIPRIECGTWQHAPLHGFRLLFPLLDSLGDVRSLQLRCVIDHGEKLRAKSVALKPQKRGLVLANRAALALLRRDPERSKFWGDKAPEVAIVEGETDFLCAACEETDTIRAVFGVSSGGWSDAHASAIPEAASVIIATDADHAGNKYAEQIRGTLGKRSFLRWTPNQGKDVCDAGGLSGGTLA